MKPQSFFRSALFIPYILWVLCALIIFPITQLNVDIPPVWDIVFMPAMFYLLGILLWFFPYTILAIILWVWSRNKPLDVLRKMGLISPILLAFLMVAEMGFLFIATNDLAGFVENVLAYSAFLGGLSLVFGYFCVGIAFGIFKILQQRGKISLQNISPEISEI